MGMATPRRGGRAPCPQIYPGAACARSRRGGGDESRIGPVTAGAWDEAVTAGGPRGGGVATRDAVSSGAAASGARRTGGVTLWIPRWSLLFVVTGIVGVVAGGGLAAGTASDPTEFPVWASAYLALVVGVVQIALGLGAGALAVRPVGAD